ncbi:hypothetical protein [Halomicronema hongdechloris]|uniref:hypothetical protein n=1 Tax=Halomicronema hongdechloris TaxID=1209493 RepID=UPI0010CB9EA3|nr:hypothetical protein [Halomicronema hongdechloris]
MHNLVQVSQALQVPMATLLRELGGPRQEEQPLPSPFRQEYERLRSQLDHQARRLRQAVQQQALPDHRALAVAVAHGGHAVEQNPQLLASAYCP